VVVALLIEKPVGDCSRQNGRDVMPGWVISPEALEDLQSIQDFIALHNPKAAEKVIEPLFAAFEALPQRTPRSRETKCAFLGGRFLSCCVSGYSWLTSGAILQGARDVLRILEMR
jgi:plasmid stabilization system protein ParE